MIINKSIDILEKSESGKMKKFHKLAKEIKYIKMQWKEKIKSHQKEAHSDKEKSCLKDESAKYNILEKLKKGGHARIIHQ